MPGRYFGYWAIFCGLFAVIFAITSFATDRWYVIEMPGPITVSLGLRSMCIRSDFTSDTSTGQVDSTVVYTALGGGNDICGSLRLDVEKLTCPGGEEISADKAYSRTNATFVLAAVGAALLVICFFAIVFLGCQGDRTKFTVLKVLSFIFILLSMICSTTGMALYYRTMDYWMYCGQEFCTHWHTLAPCQSSFGFSFYFLVFAVILSGFVALSLLFGGCRVICGATGGDNATPGGQGQRRSESPAPANRPAVYQTQQDDREMLQPTNATSWQQNQKKIGKDPHTVGLDSTWIWDAESSYWWSDAEQLYFDESSGHYFDGESEQWYNPESGQWYHA